MTRQHAQHAPHHPVRGGFGVAFLSFLEYQGLTDAVVELRDPVLEGDALSYQVTVLEGKIPSNAGLASLFIDIIGMR